MQPFLGDFRRFESQQGIGFCAEIGFDFSQYCSGGHFFLLVFLHARKADSYSRIPFESIAPAAASTSQSSFPFCGWSNWAGNCCGSKGTSSTAFSGGALAGPLTMKMMSSRLQGTGTVRVKCRADRLPV